jgi:hypothetical protein
VEKNAGHSYCRRKTRPWEGAKEIPGNAIAGKYKRPGKAQRERYLMIKAKK